MPFTNTWDEQSNLAAVVPRLLYHAAPLHYLPSILHLGMLLAASIGRERKILPRRSAERRDRMLGVDSYVHLALDPITPLVRDKLANGMPHALIEFDGHAVFEHCACSVLPYNTKAWKTKYCMKPVSDDDKVRELLRDREEFGRYPSMEVLVLGQLSLRHCVSIHVFSQNDYELVVELTGALHLTEKFRIRFAPAVPGYSATKGDLAVDYIRQCVRSREVLALPSNIEFD